MLTMTQKGHWGNREAVIQYLAYQLVHGRLGLLLGAGISYPFGLPKWEELQRRMFEALREKPPATLDLRTIEALRLRRFARNRADFAKAVKEALYKTADLSFEQLSSNRVLMSIASLMMSSRRGNVSTVITVNYDDVLETLLNFFGFVTCSISSEQHWTPAADVAIYHPHGYLPHRLGESGTDDLVLDQESFAKIIGKSELPWYQIMATVFRTRTMLCIGIGGADPNIDSLLVAAKQDHAIGTSQVKFSGIVVNTSFSRDEAAVWKNRGLFPLKIADYETDLAPLLLRVCQQAAEARRAPD
jgi:hypothetical protein